MSIFLLISQAVHDKIYEGKTPFAAMDTPCRHTRTHTHAVHAAEECNKAPLFLCSIIQNAKDLCVMLAVCVCVLRLKGRQKAIHAALARWTWDMGHRTRDTGHGTKDTQAAHRRHIHSFI